jgi:NhaA family Na+:H+ antiporter
MHSRIAPLRDFLHRESTSGIFLLAAACLGLLVANSPWRENYFSILETGFEYGSGFFYLKLTILKVINYILMTLFFFVVGLEIKRELTSGHLSTLRNAIMPFIAAIGGMALPAAIYLAIAGRVDSRGWGVPVATDIALAVGLLALVGSSVTPSLRTFLLGLAVIDDIGAILIIAFIYSAGVDLVWVTSACFSILIIKAMSRLGVRHSFFYIFVGSSLWYFLYRSGIHATLSGVILGLLTPNIKKTNTYVDDVEDGSITIIEWLEARLHPWTSFIIVPIFAFANTGIEISLGALKSAANSPIAWGIFAGLVIGKPLGIILSVTAAKRMNLGDYPENSSKPDILATGSAAGIGFTVAIFIANLAFRQKADQELAIIAVIFASVISGIMSYLLFKLLRLKRSRPN